MTGGIALNERIVHDGVERGELAAGLDPAGAVALLEVFGAGLTLLAGGDRDPEYLAMLDVAGAPHRRLAARGARTS